MADKEIIDVSKCPFLDEWKHCNLCKEFAKIQNRHLLIEADLRCEEQPSELCYFKQLQSKTAECEKLEEKWSIGFQKFCDKDNKLQHYKQALDEIEGLAKNFCKNCGDSKDCNDGKEGCYYSLIPDLFNSISKAKEADNESYK